MNKTIVHCKVITPLFMAGADQRKPEIRVASIKGNMRYIWRAIQRASNITELREAEGVFFGNAYGGNKTKSSMVKMRIENMNTTEGSVNMLPHRKLHDYDGNSSPYFAPAIKSGGTFDLVFTSFADVELHIEYIRLYVITCLIYGFGRRSRKGLGAIDITGICGVGEDEVDYYFSGATINLNILSKFNAKYSCVNNNVKKITATNTNGASIAYYPYIEKIEIFGTKFIPDASKIVGRMGIALHNAHSKPFLGMIKPKRFAASTLLSVTPWNDKDYCCVVTQLHCTEDFDDVERENFYDDLYRRV